ncbi:MAG: hypothetical protein JKX98_10560 [Alcanivoracaceae bacterium]|nr:hypothetical protein [Alcanivoracaceae bacterium]
MKYLSQKSEYKFITTLISEIIIDHKSLPENVFQRGFNKFSLIDFDWIFSDGFFEKIINLLLISGDKSFYFAVLDPEPETYYFKHFKKYNIVEFNNDDSENVYFNALNSDPGDSPADALSCNSSKLILFSESKDWAFYCDRYYELCICAFSNNEVKEVFDIHFKEKVLNRNEIGNFISDMFSNNLGGIVEEFKKSFF